MENKMQTTIVLGLSGGYRGDSGKENGSYHTVYSD